MRRCEFVRAAAVVWTAVYVALAVSRGAACRLAVPENMGFCVWDAIELAARERVSGSGDPTRGIGLFGVSEDMRKPGRSLIIHSGIGMLQITSPDIQTAARRSTLFPGTLAWAAIAT